MTMDKVVQNVWKFFQDKKLKGPFLLAYSGGIDSKALLYILLEIQKYHPFSFEIAHVDHGLRSESSEEASIILEEAKRFQIPCHVKKLPRLASANIEDQCRKFRYEFFEKVSTERHLPTVLTAHHADDISETTLKRVLEGAQLTNLKGILPLSNRGNYQVARPLYHLKKKDLYCWLEKKGLQGFEDPTNQGKENLRARLRSEIIPDLESKFGKNVTKNLTTLSDASLKLEEYLDEKVQPYINQMHTGPWGCWLDVKELHPFELGHLFYVLSKEHQIDLSREELLYLVNSISNGKVAHLAKRELPCIWTYRSMLFIQTCDLLVEWELDRVEDSIESQVMVSDWEDLARGYAWAVVPKGDYTVSLSSGSEILLKKSLKDRWSLDKVPQIYRSLSLVLKRDNLIIADFLTGCNAVSKTPMPLQKIVYKLKRLKK